MDNMITLPYVFDKGRPDCSVQPFVSNEEFLEEKFREYLLLIRRSILRAKTTGSRIQTAGNPKNNSTKGRLAADQEKTTREYETMRTKNAERMLVSGDCHLPFAALARSYELDEIAEHILWLLFFHAVAPDFEVSRSSAETEDFITKGKDLYIRDIVRLLAPGSLGSQMAVADYFGVESPLVRHHLVEVYPGWARSFLDIEVNIPARVVKYIADNETEYEANNAFIVERPDIPLDFVVLPEDQKKSIQTFIDNYEKSLEKQAETGLDRVLTYGRSLVILLYGPPGTGKTLLAKAIASHTGRPLLSIRSSRASAPLGRAVYSDRYIDEDDIEEIFREAKMRNGIVFLDECEQLCSKNNNRLYAVLREIEHAECIVIMATNVPNKLGEALDRRITLKVQFQVPGAPLRQSIWEKHLLGTVPLDPGVDLGALAEKYRLGGGYIKNAILSAMNIAFSRNGGGPFALTADDLDGGAKLQENHLNNLSSLIQHLWPDKDIDDLVLPSETRRVVESITKTVRGYRELTSRIKFINGTFNKGCKLLFFGPSFASAMDSVEAIACRLGTGICSVAFDKVLEYGLEDDKSYGDFIRSRAQEISSAAHATGQVLLLVDREGNMAKFEDDKLKKAGEFLSCLGEYDGIVFMVSGARQPKNVVKGFFHYSFLFDVMSPSERLKCWQRITEAIDLAEDVNLERIADEYELSTEEIQNALYTACLLSAGETPEGNICNRLLEEGIRNVLRTNPGAKPLFGSGWNNVRGNIMW